MQCRAQHCTIDNPRYAPATKYFTPVFQHRCYQFKPQYWFCGSSKCGDPRPQERSRPGVKYSFETIIVLNYRAKEGVTYNYHILGYTVSGRLDMLGKLLGSTIYHCNYLHCSAQNCTKDQCYNLHCTALHCNETANMFVQCHNDLMIALASIQMLCPHIFVSDVWEDGASRIKNQ